jgi:hypothetical protein
MEPQALDRVTRLFHAARSRRTAWQVLLGTALFRGATISGTATPRPKGARRGGDRCDPTTCPQGPEGDGFCCPGNRGCSCNGECCPGHTGCFVNECEERCCTRPELIICRDPTGGKDLCCLNVGKDSCATCIDPPPLRQCGLAGSYRRR